VLTKSISQLKCKIVRSLGKQDISGYLAGIGVLLSRFIKILPNFSLVGSFGFFQSNLIVFFAQILAFDLFFGGVYKGFLFTYLGFFSYWVFGRLAGDKLKNQLFMLPFASFLFFLISNLGVWWFWYARTFSGLITCYTLALPFYRNTLLGDLFFGGMIIMIRVLARMLNTTEQRSYVDSK